MNKRTSNAIASFLILLVLSLGACGQQDSTANQPAADGPPVLTDGNSDSPQEAAPASATSPAPAKEPRVQLRKIPSKHLVINLQPEPFPLAAAGLRFQLAQMDLPANSQFLRPLGGGDLAKNGDIYLSFPSRDLIVKMSFPSYDLSYFGQKRFGGKDELVTHAHEIALWDGEISVSDAQGHKVSVFGPDFQLLKYFDFGKVLTVSGPGRQFLAISQKKPGIFFRINSDGAVRQNYQLPLDKNRSLAAQQLRFHIYPNWEAAAVRADGSRLTHLETNGARRHQFYLDWAAFSPGVPVTVCQIAADAGGYWLLLQKSGDTTHSYLIHLHFETGVTAFWQCPFPATGMAFNADTLLLFNHELAAAATYKWRP